MHIEANSIKWIHEYDVGVIEIDFQHRYFLKLIQRVEKLFQQGMDDYMATRHFNEILAYASFHFQSEENLMMLSEYPGLQEHRELHKDLLEEIGTTIYYFHLKKKTWQEVIDMMVDWFIKHTVKEDSKFGHFHKTQEQEAK